MAAGIRSSLHIAYTSDLVREINLDCDAAQLAPPAIGKSDAANLMRLSIAATTMLQSIAQEHIDRLNKFWDEP